MEVGAALLAEALQRDPEHREALRFLAKVELYGRDDPDRALDLLQRLEARPGLDDRLRAQIEAATADAEAARQETP